MTSSRRWLRFMLLLGIALALAPSFARRAFDGTAVLAQTRAPTIQVLEDGSTVVSNSGGSPSSDPVDFTPTTPGVPVSETLTIRNLSATAGDDLILNDLILPDGFEGGFNGSEAEFVVIAPSGTATLDIICVSDTEGVLEGLVSFQTNDSANLEFTFTIRCEITTSTPPAIEVVDGSTPITNGTLTPVILPTTTVNIPSVKLITIRNTGEQPLTLSELAFDGIFTGSFTGGLDTVTLAPDTTTTLTINCLSSSAATFDSTVEFDTTDPSDPTFTFPVRCVVNPVDSDGAEIDVIYDVISITDGQTTPVVLGAFNTGSLFSRDITIRNFGTQPLTLSNLVIAPEAGSQMQVGGTLAATTVQPGSSTTLTISCGAEIVGQYRATVSFNNNDADENPFNFTIQCNFEFQTPTFTLTPTYTRTPVATGTGFPTVVIPTSFLTPFTLTPSLVPTFTPFPTFIFTPFQRTPLPPPACARQSPPIPPTGVVVLVNRDGVNVRSVPAIGAPLIGFVNAGYTVEAQARSGDNQWVRVQFAPGQQGWIGMAVLTVLSGTVETMPVADPRSIPYGGFDTPRAGITGATSSVTGRLAQSGLRVRSGPSTNYVVLANAPRYSVMPILGRTADNRWVQVNFEGTLGWAAAEYFEFSSPDVFNTPVDGICADGVPLSESGDGGFFDMLRFIRDRIDLAQPSLDAIRTIWTNVALGGVAQCGNYPVRPTDVNIPQALLAAYNRQLLPLQTDFNIAMGSIRLAVELLMQACNFPQPTAGSVGQAVVQQALDAVNRADALFADMRRRIAEQLPPDELAPDECLFVYTGQAAVVKRLEIGQPRNAQLTSRPARYVNGFCFDAPAGRNYRVEILRLSGIAAPRLTVGSFDNPTNFIAQTDLGSSESYTALQPILIPQDGRYLLLVSDLELSSTAGQGDFVILLTDVTGVPFSAPSLTINPQTGQITINPVPSPLLPTVVATQAGQASGVCPNVTFTCDQLLSCEQALSCLLAGNSSLDGDDDGIPCENLCGFINPTLDPT